MNKKVVVIITLIILCVMGRLEAGYISAQTVQKVSLFTCTEGDELYSLFGHTAIRCVFEDSLGTQEDVTFNYGAFSYSADNFVLNFISGKTDYILACEETNDFLTRYQEKGIGVTEQVLNLTDKEQTDLLKFLLNNAKPENNIYRYNWLYDNCTTRARDVIESVIQGNVVYPKEETLRTCRENLNNYTSVDSWIELGINMLLGSEVDEQMNDRTQTFLPKDFQQVLAGAYVINPTGEKICLVKDTTIAVPQVFKPEIASVNWPVIIMSIILLLCIIVGVIEVRNMEVFRRFAVVLYGVIGLIGSLISFMFLFSEHAGVSTNCLVAIFNPLYFALIPFVLQRETKKVSLAVLATIIIFLIWKFAVGQVISTAVWMLVLILLSRVVVNALIYIREINSKAEN